MDVYDGWMDGYNIWMNGYTRCMDWYIYIYIYIWMHVWVDTVNGYSEWIQWMYMDGYDG